MSVFIQWNMRSMNSSWEKLNILLSTYNPDVVCLQETQLKADTNVVLKHYSVFHHPGDNSGSSVHGGTALLVKSSISPQQIMLRLAMDMTLKHFIARLS